MASHDESFSTSTELALMFGNFFGVAEADNLSIDTDSSGTATKNFDQTPQANIISGRQTGLDLTNNGTQQAESTTTPNLLAAQTPTSTINVNYNGFSTQAQAAFEYAVDIWENLIVSPVPIEVEANWTSFGTNALGSAGPNDYDYNFANAAYTNTWYPSALANSLAGFDLDTTAHDINANFNSDYSNWYFGTDGNAQTGQYDFVSVVLHELGHGLGFLGNMNYDSNTEQGSWWSQPVIYDHFTVNGSGQKLIDTFPNNSVALGAQLTSDNLFFNGSNAVAANGGTNPKLYAPSIWDSGSSYAHLDEATYGSGNSNALMTPQIGTGEAHHHPGAVTLGIFEDLGWVINAQPQADLWGWDFNVNPEPLDAGDSFNIDFEITNTGGSAGAFDVSFYLSSNNTISTLDHLLGSTTINGLAGNSTRSFTTSLNLPSVNHSFWDLYGDYTYYIGMRVDSGADVTETNETNNSNVGFLYDYDDVVINNTQLADLSGSDFNVNPEPLDAGDSFNIDFDITNTGGSAGAFDVSFYLSSNNTISTVDHLLGSATINGLAGNSTGSFTTSLNLPGVNHSFWNGDGTYYIGMRVDSGADVTETNETNNSNVGFLFDYDDVAINNTQLADLSGSDFDVTPEPLDAGDSFDIDFDITNTGSSAGAFDVSFYLSSNNYISTVDQLLGSTTINSLAGNSTGSFTTSLNLPGVDHSFWNGDGTYYIGMRVDSGTDVTETNETNNSNVGFLFDYDDVVINNTQLADLSGSDFDVTPEPLDAGDSFDIDFDITNTGSSAGAFDVSFYLSSNNTISTVDQFLGSTTINGLAGNSTGSFTTSLNLPGVNHSFWNLYGDDTYYIGMQVDSGADVTETNETNNSNVGFLFDYDDVVINNTQLADLSGVYFDVTPEPLDAGDSFDIDFDITNTGSSAGAFDVSFYLSSNNTISTVDHLLGSATINGLAGNSTGSFTTSLNLPGVNHSFWDLYGDDTYYIGMRVDSGSDVTEVNETNNSNVGFLFDYDDVAINNTQLADLSGVYFDVTPEPLDAGDSFDIDFDITNTGSSAGAFDVSFYLSSNNTISTTDHLLGSATINGLAGNSTGSFTTSLNLPGVNHSFWNLYGDDTYYIGMQVDAGSDVTEVNETNNSNVGFLFDYDDVAINNTQIANLSGLNFNVTPEPLNAGDSFDIDLTIENSGAAAAGAFDVSLYLSSDSSISNSDLLLDTISFTGLAANSSGTFTSNFILPEANDAFWSGDGSYHIGMMVDSGDDITETIETDNANVGLMLDTDNVVINNTQLADLVGVDFNLVQEPLAAGDHFDVNFEVQNTEMFAAGAFDVSFYVSTDNTIDTADQFLGSTTINGLAGNSIGAYTTGLTLPGINDSTWKGDGIYYIGMIIDQDGTLPETDETNNANNGLFVDYDNVLISDTELIGTDDDDTLFGTPGDDILSGLRDDDDLVGGGGDDTLFGDRGDDNLFGEAGNDMLFGDRGDDYLFGGTGNDIIYGDRGDDLLIGVELNLANPGLGEVDSLIGGFGADVFQLGDVFSAYYDDADGTTDGSTDYALITDFDINQDIIELHGSAADYQLATVSPSLPSGIGVFLQSSTPSGQDELIGIVQGESSLSLNDSYFSFV